MESQNQIKYRSNDYGIQCKILIADENSEQRQILKENLMRAGYRFIEEAVNGEEALLKINRFHPDIALIDIWLSKFDGIGVIRNCKSINFAPDNQPAFIIVSMVSNQNIFVEATNAGADLCLLKPFDYVSLLEHISVLSKTRSHGKAAANPAPSDNIPQDMETQVTKIIHQIGVPAHIKGYQYLRTAILLTVKDSEIINSVTKVLYPSVARKFDTTPEKVERAIRNAIEAAWSKEGCDVFVSLLGYSGAVGRGIATGRSRPTNSEFIAMIADRISLKFKNELLRGADCI
jgi:two-component system response regulator (stage 0 sporulation protein A)